MRDITGCVAMISGANRGIGEAIAAALHADGWALSLGARDLAALEASAARYRTDVVGSLGSGPRLWRRRVMPRRWRFSRVAALLRRH